MKTLNTLLGAGLVAAAFAMPAQAADVVVMKFRADDCATCSTMENQVDTAVAMVGTEKVSTITIDTSNAALWEKGAHEAFDKNVVPVFNQYVGLTGLTVIVDSKTQRPIGCVNSNYDAQSVASFLQRASGQATTTRASVRVDNFNCPPAHNKL